MRKDNLRNMLGRPRETRPLNAAGVVSRTSGADPREHAPFATEQESPLRFPAPIHLVRQAYTAFHRIEDCTSKSCDEYNKMSTERADFEVVLFIPLCIDRQKNRERRSQPVNQAKVLLIIASLVEQTDSNEPAGRKLNGGVSARNNPPERPGRRSKHATEHRRKATAPKRYGRNKPGL